MPGTLSKLDLIDAVDELFDNGVNPVRFLALQEEDAKRYAQAFEFNVRYHAEVHGPSVENDPLKTTPLYSVIIKLIGHPTQ